VTDAAVYLPDAMELKSYFVEVVAHNLDWADEYAQTSILPLGFAASPGFDDGVDPGHTRLWVSFWGLEYAAWAIDHANKQGFSGGRLWRDQLASFETRYLADPQYRDGAGPYRLPVADWDGAATYYTEIAQCYLGPTSFQGYYGPESRLMTIIGLENGFPGAQIAYDYIDEIESVWIFVAGVSDLALRSGWAVLPDLGPAPEIPTSFYTLSPCRVLDTRDLGAPLEAGSRRGFPIAGICGIPATARSVSLNVTVTLPNAAGDLRVVPGGAPATLTSTINYRAGQTRANNGVLALGNGGTLDVVCAQPNGSVHLILDVNGYFE
jgi:hypothetical protein